VGVCGIIPEVSWVFSRSVSHYDGAQIMEQGE
jgi:hypothetical protein